jgi:hypothetical protein
VADATTGPAELLARLSFLQPLLAGRRVLLVGAGAHVDAAAGFLAARGVASVSVADDAPDAGADHGVVVDAAPLDPGDPRRIAALRGLLAPGGVLAAAALPDQRDAVVAALAASFPSVEVAAVLPVEAWAVAPAAARPGAVTWDGSMLRGAGPASYLLVCADAPTGLAVATVTALPSAAAVDPREARASAEVRAILERADASLAAAQVELEQAVAREADLRAEVATLLWQKDEADEARARAVAERDRLAAAARSSGEGDVADLLPG